MRKILFLSKGVNASSTRYRATDFFPLLEADGWQPTHITDRRTLPVRWQILRAAAQADAVVIVRRTYGPVFARLLRQVSRQLIFTFDDAIFAKSNGDRSPGRERRFAATLPLCDRIWAGNRYLADRARPLNHRVEIIPTAVDIDRYDIPAEKPRTTLDLVWIGSRSTKKHLITVLPALEAAAKQLPALRLKIIADFTLTSERLEIAPIRWSPAAECRELASAHIGIAPLPDNPFTRGKCGLKVLQYMAAGLPVIASPTGVNQEMVESGVSGQLATTQQEWLTAIQRLARDEALRKRMGAAGRQRCREHFTLAAAFQKMRAALATP